MRAILRSTRSLRFLHRRRFGVIENLPSWVPDWSSNRSQKSIGDSRMEFSSSNGLLHVLDDSLDVSNPTSLVVRGKIVACVTKTAAHRFGIVDFSESVSECIGSLTLIPQVATELKTATQKDSNMARTSTWIRWLLATTLTCGRFLCEDKDRFDTENCDDYTDLPDVIKATGPSYVRSPRKCVGRKLAMLDKWHL